MKRGLLLCVALPSIVAASDFFEMKIRPTLAKNCFACHTNSKMGGLDLSSRASVLAGGKSGPAIKPGAPSESLLLKAIRHDDPHLKMPPSGGKLPDTVIADFETWIQDGAKWSDAKAPVTAAKLWSLQPVAAPKAKSIDEILKAGNQPKADKRTLLRRLSYDLTGLPPTPAEMDAFLADKSPDAYAKAVDRLLASPHYGERWSRHWLDVARYSDDKLDSERDAPRPNAKFYRDWVTKAFNDDLPYDTFVKAHVAADAMKDRPDLLPALGFYGLSPEFQDDRVDVTTRGFMGFTVACAQCHDHKFDPIPTKDFYALQGVFNNTELHEYPLAEKAVVDEYDRKKKDLEAREKDLKDFENVQAGALANIFTHQTARFLEAARGKGPADGLDKDVLERWKKYLARTNREHKYLDDSTNAEEFQKLLLATDVEKKDVDDKNHITLGSAPNREDLSQANLLSLPRDKFFLWRDFYHNNGVYTIVAAKLPPYLTGEFKAHHEYLSKRVDDAKKALPKQYPFLYGIADKAEKDRKVMKIHIRGNPQNLGEEAPPVFLTALGGGKLTTGSGRLELAEKIASRDNPLTARVMVNRIWLEHFGEGIVKTPSNFGNLGERPSNPELLDYLAWRFMENGWSIKKLHREILLSQAYQAVHPDQRRRLDAEAVRDSLLFVAGTLDPKVGGDAEPITEKNHRRTMYGSVSRRRLDPMLSLFDFPNPNQTSEQRITTDVPLQRLFLLNSPIVMQACEDLAKRIENEKDRVTAAYKLLFQREPTAKEKQLANTFLTSANGTWPEYLQVLYSSDEFLYLN